MRYLKVAFILSAALNVLSEEFIQVHTSCKYWDKLNIYSNGGSKELHCILDQDKVPGIVYTEWIAVPSGYCPVYNRRAKVIDCIPCNGSIGDCPTELVKSYQAVLYTGCFQMPLVEKCVTTTMSTPVQEPHTKDMGIYIGLTVMSLLATTLLFALIGTWIWIKRYRCQSEFETVKETIITSERRTTEEIKRWSDSINCNSANPESNGTELSLLPSHNKEDINISKTTDYSPGVTMLSK